MILVNVVFQELKRTYDFKLDWDASIYKITEEIVKMISQTEHLPEAANPGQYLLYKKDSTKIMDPNTTLSENGVRSGDTLLLI